MTFGELKAHAARHGVPDGAELLVWCGEHTAPMGQVVFEHTNTLISTNTLIAAGPVAAIVFSPSTQAPEHP